MPQTARTATVGESGGGERTPGESSLLTAKEVAELLGVHVSTVWRLTQRVENPLRAVRFGERITRFRPADVESLIANGREGEL